MGACMSSGGIEVTEEDKRLHREAEKSLREVRSSMSPSLTLVSSLSLTIGEGQDGSTSQGPPPWLWRFRKIHNPEANAAYPPSPFLLAGD